MAVRGYNAFMNLLSVLGIYYVTLVLSEYDGLFGVFLYLRRKSPKLLRDLLECFVCTSFWVSLVYVLLSGVNISYALAYAGAATVIHKVTQWDL